MNHMHTILTANRPDLLTAAVASVKPIWRHTQILDNSEDGYAVKDCAWPVPVIRPIVPLSYAQSMNYLQSLAEERGLGAWSNQHDDAEAGPETAEKFIAAIEQALAGDIKWASIWTQYDIISAFCTAAVAKIGVWDTLFPCPNYHIDNDWFRRAKLMGYETIKTDLLVKHITGGSATANADPLTQLRTQITFEHNQTYYRHKWGGPVHEETKTSPWSVG